MSAMPEASRPSGNQAANDADQQETREWLDALSAVIGTEGGDRAHFLLEQLIDHARQAGIDVPFSANTAYLNTIPTDQEARCPGNIEIEERLRAYMRWNAMAMVVKANRHNPADGGDLGGHIGSFASLAHMFGEVADVLGDVVELGAVDEPGDLLAVYERWRLHGDPRDAKVLVRAGVMLDREQSDVVQ